MCKWTKIPAPPLRQQEVQVYLNVSVGQQQVDDDVDWEALHVVQSLLDAAQLGGQFHARVELPSFADLVQDCLPEVLTAKGQDGKGSLVTS